MMYKWLNNKIVFIFVGGIAILLFVTGELFYELSVREEAILFTITMISITGLLNTKNRMSNDQVIESLERLSISSKRISGHARDFLEQYASYRKRVSALNTIQYLDSRNTTLLRNIIQETEIFVQKGLKKAYGTLLVMDNRVSLAEDQKRVAQLYNGIQAVLDKLDEIAFAINDFGYSAKDYKEMTLYLSDILENLRIYTQQ